MQQQNVDVFLTNEDTALGADLLLFMPQLGWMDGCRPYTMWMDGSKNRCAKDVGYSSPAYERLWLLIGGHRLAMGNLAYVGDPRYLITWHNDYYYQQ